MIGFIAGCITDRIVGFEELDVWRDGALASLRMIFLRHVRVALYPGDVVEGEEMKTTRVGTSDAVEVGQK